MQIFDAASSIVLNLTESSGRKAPKDKAHFLDIANGSAHETAGGLCAADRLTIGPPEVRERMLDLLLEIISLLTVMSRNLKSTAPLRRR